MSDFNSCLNFVQNMCFPQQEFVKKEKVEVVQFCDKSVLFARKNSTIWRVLTFSIVKSQTWMTTGKASSSSFHSSRIWTATIWMTERHQTLMEKPMEWMTMMMRVSVRDRFRFSAAVQGLQMFINITFKHRRRRWGRGGWRGGGFWRRGRWGRWWRRGWRRGGWRGWQWRGWGTSSLLCVAYLQS